jgi:uncharacterized protein YggE
LAEIIMSNLFSPRQLALWMVTVGISAMGCVAHADDVRRVSVSGTGQVSAEPDRAIVVLGIDARKPKIEEARADVTRTIDAVLKLARDQKFDPKYVRSTRLTVEPEYDWNNQNKERTLLGYHVARQVQIELRDLEKLGVLLERAIDLGVNQIGDPQLDSTRRAELERAAMTSAVQDARQNAEVIAHAAGARLGAVRTVSASSGTVPSPAPMRMMAMKSADSSPSDTYKSGEMSFTANVQAEYDLIVTAP